MDELIKVLLSIENALWFIGIVLMLMLLFKRMS